MFNYFKNRYKFFIPTFILGFFSPFLIENPLSLEEFIVLGIYLGICLTITAGNLFYYMIALKIYHRDAVFRSFKYIGIIILLAIITAIILTALKS